MAADFGVDYATMTLAVSGYFAATALVQLFLAPLSDRVGRRPVMLAGFALFSVASLICALAPNYEVFFVGRLLQCAVATGSALSAAIVRDTAPPAEAAQRLGTIGMAMAFAPMIGPLLGGALDTVFGWRANFLLYTALGFGTLALLWTDLGETARARGGGLGTSLRGYRALLGSGTFWANALASAFSASIFFAFTATAPLVGAVQFGLSPAAVGLSMATTPLGYVVGNALTRRLAGRVRLTRMMVAGRLATLAGLAVALGAAAMSAPPWLFFALMVFVGIGNGLTIPNAMVGAMSVRPELAGSASGLSGALTVGAGALATALAGAVISLDPRPQTLALMLLVGAVAALAAALAADARARSIPSHALESTPEDA